MNNNLIRKPKVSVEQENQYTKLGFVQNPFPANPSVVPYSDDIRVNGSIFLEKIPPRRNRCISTAFCKFSEPNRTDDGLCCI